MRWAVSNYALIGTLAHELVVKRPGVIIVDDFQGVTRRQVIENIRYLEVPLSGEHGAYIQCYGISPSALFCAHAYSVPACKITNNHENHIPRALQRVPCN